MRAHCFHRQYYPPPPSIPFPSETPPFSLLRSLNKYLWSSVPCQVCTGAGTTDAGTPPLASARGHPQVCTHPRPTPRGWASARKGRGEHGRKCDLTHLTLSAADCAGTITTPFPRPGSCSRERVKSSGAGPPVGKWQGLAFETRKSGFLARAYPVF